MLSTINKVQINKIVSYSCYEFSMLFDFAYGSKLYLKSIIVVLAKVL